MIENIRKQVAVFCREDRPCCGDFGACCSFCHADVCRERASYGSGDESAALLRYTCVGRIDRGVLDVVLGVLEPLLRCLPYLAARKSWRVLDEECTWL